MNKENIGKKLDNGKLRYGLLPCRALEEVVKVLTLGAIKYEPDNWRYVENGKYRYFDAAQRHQWLRKQGEIFDRELRTHHLANAICCLMFHLELDILDVDIKEGEKNEV